MSLKNAAIATVIVAGAMTTLVAVSPSGGSTAAVAESAPPAQSAIDIEAQRSAAAAELARVAAEESRQQVPQVLAARAEAQRLAEEQARAEAEAKARAEAEAQRKAEAEAQRKAEEQRRAQQQAAAQAQQQAPSAPAASAPAPVRDYGMGPSAYTGPYYDAALEGTRQCIVKKESGGNYGIVSRNGLYFGAYQFSRPTGDATARKMGRGDLVGVPVNAWSRAEQDEAFWTLWNHGAGRGNWPTAAGC